MIYRVHPDSLRFRHVLSDADWRFESRFLHPNRITDWKPPTLWPLSLDDDVAYELDMAEADENGDPERARRRHALGFADLMWVQGISTLLLLSGRARKALGEQLAASGQLLDAVLNGDVVHFFHCTTLIAATAEGSRVHYLPGGKPSGAPELVLEPAAIPSTGFFRTNWPAPPPGLPEVDYTTFPPPTALFATQAVVERVADSGLTGFRFDNTRLSGLGS